jgi:hypothetical protein
MNTITIDSRPFGNPDYALQKDGSGWTALVNLDTASGVALNETGMMVWQAANGKRTVAGIIDYVKDHFSDPPASVGEDVIAILETLLDAGLIGFEVNL